MKRAFAVGSLLLSVVMLAGCVRIPAGVTDGQGSAHTTAPTTGESTASVSMTSTGGPTTTATVKPVAPQDQPQGVAAPSHVLHGPKVGSPERKAILDALRPPIEATLHQPVVFKCDHFMVESGWAFVRGTPIRPDGRKIDYGKTKYQAAIADGFFDDGFAALLHYREGAWHVTKWEIGATDVAWEPWADDYGAPRTIF